MFNKKSILAMTTALLWLNFSTVQAEEITLRSLDENTSMTGNLLGFDGDIYQLETAIGILSLSVLQVSCEGADCPDLMANVNEFSIAGSNSLGLQMMPAMIEAYAFELGGDLEVEAVSSEQIVYTIFDATGDVYSVITVNLGTSNDAFAALESREASIGLSSRRVTTGERNRFLRAGQGDLTSPELERILALDGMVITVNPGNPIRTLSLDQISDIFAGNIRNWREVGGADASINVYRRDQESGATQVFENLVMAPTRRVLANTAFIHATNAAVSDAVAQDRNAIGITSVSEERNAKILSLRSICGQVSAPSEFSIKTEEYPMSRRMFLYTTSSAIPDKAVEFIDFVTSNAAQDIVEQVGFVSQNVATASLNNQGRRLAHALTSERDRTSLALLQEMVASLLESERLSLTFRFKSGSVSPDNRAVVDIARLAEMVRSGEFDGKRLLIIGFADSIGAINENQRLSQARAESIRDVLVEAVGAEAGTVQFTPVGYGKLSPIGCNETDDGRDTNRRVEVWVR
ncbi:MAG: substrate-binding domain-containing protein [Rhodobacteraceae bacterium]|nr:substrate-binding domain-containing protein [Paracoccaceae bacterium]